MERTLIAWNLPNMITVPLMAAIAWLVFGALWQVAKKRMPNKTSSTANNEGGY